MAIGPWVRMGPSPRSFAADAHDCIMVQVENMTCRIQVCGASARARWQAPLGSNQSHRFEIADNSAIACSPILSRMLPCAGQIKAKPLGRPRKTRPALTGPAQGSCEIWRSGRKNGLAARVEPKNRSQQSQNSLAGFGPKSVRCRDGSLVLQAWCCRHQRTVDQLTKCLGAE